MCSQESLRNFQNRGNALLTHTSSELLGRSDGRRGSDAEMKKKHFRRKVDKKLFDTKVNEEMDQKIPPMSRGRRKTILLLWLEKKEWLMQSCQERKHTIKIIFPEPQVCRWPRQTAKQHQLSQVCLNDATEQHLCWYSDDGSSLADEKRQTEETTTTTPKGKVTCVYTQISSSVHLTSWCK